jgi:hypothetical protein
LLTWSFSTSTFSPIPRTRQQRHGLRIEGTVATGQMLAITQNSGISKASSSGFTQMQPLAGQGLDLEGEFDFAVTLSWGRGSWHDRAGGDTTRQWTIELSAKTAPYRPPAMAHVPRDARPGTPRVRAMVTGAVAAPIPAASGRAPPTWCRGLSLPWCPPGFATW